MAKLGGPLAATLPFERFFSRGSQIETSGLGPGRVEARVSKGWVSARGPPTSVFLEASGTEAKQSHIF